MFGVQIFVIGQLIAGGLLQPINHDYVPNLANNVWPSIQSPFYDQESRYSIPWAIWNTGIMWRNDEIDTDIAGAREPVRGLLERRSRGQDGSAQQLARLRWAWRCSAGA